MKVFYDIHLHSCLSPCGDADMTPVNIVGMAKLCGLDMIAVSDHNSCLNCPAVLSEAEKQGILAIPAMELTTADEAHVLCLLPDLNAALDFSDYVYSKLPGISNKSHIFGSQIIIDENDRIAGEERRFLLAATRIGIHETHELLRSYGGIAIPAHVDRNSFSALTNLGDWDLSWGFAAYEQYDRSLDLTDRYPAMKGLKRIFNSDAHRLENMRDAENAMILETLSAREALRQLAFNG